MSDTKDFGETAKGLARNPLGIIALFIVLVYGFACLVTAFSSSFTAEQKTPLIYFLVGFPVLVLSVFCWLVSKHSGKLFAPEDFKNEENYMKMQMSAVASLTLASAKSQPPTTSLEVEHLVEMVQHAKPTATSPAPDGWRRQVLWVDDRPDNNIHERSAFESVGITFTLAESTNEALRILSTRKFAAIISDMGRREGPREGYVLLDAVRSGGDQTPFFFYASSNAPQHKRETAEHGGQGCTNNPQELFQSVTRAILGAN
ncbi:response regulator [Edaphobacter flagellatus]|uniref:response regulator n=1 Tax=Edaphobacter flagellatus TaxID=1933044 RepID=UPI0021B4656C|nr:response regulator [Edaphobacter flagellatus]